jgi:hypothetical protein
MGGAGVEPAYIEDFFQTWLSTGTGTTRTVTGPDMTKGGLSITKSRSGTTGWRWVDTARGAGLSLESNSSNAQASEATGVTAFTATGTSIGADADYNTSGATYVDFLIRKQPKFFDVVTWTGNDVVGRTVAHNLGSVPGCIIVKRTDIGGTGWQVYHQSLGNTQYAVLNDTAAAATGSNRWNNTTPTDTVFSLGASSSVNEIGGTYVAYLFAHNAGGFGLTGTDNVISCGSYSGTGFDIPVTLGWEPQWLLVKNISNEGKWQVMDNMRGLPANGNSIPLHPNTSEAEIFVNSFNLRSTGFVVGSNFGDQYIYIAIRRGPMKVPTTGTSVFAPTYGLSASNSEFVNAGFPIDLNWRGRTTGDNVILQDRLRGASQLLFSNLTDAESSSSAYVFTTQNGCTFTSTASFTDWINWSFRRAPGFFDVVCYTGTGTNAALTHNLNVIPEMMIHISRSGSAYGSFVYHKDIGATKALVLNTTVTPVTSSVFWNNTAPTSTVFTVAAGSGGGITNESGVTYVQYLFASCPGVSKVFSYTGNGSSQTINCGFTGGARFILIKRTDSTGDWYVWDTARGIVAGNDPHLSLNTTAAEVTTDDTIDTDSTGFVVNQVAATNVNVNAATYIGLAIS